MSVPMNQRSVTMRIDNVDNVKHQSADDNAESKLITMQVENHRNSTSKNLLNECLETEGSQKSRRRNTDAVIKTKPLSSAQSKSSKSKNSLRGSSQSGEKRVKSTRSINSSG